MKNEAAPLAPEYNIAKPIRKSETKRFQDVCQKIREALNLEHLEREYRLIGRDGTGIAAAEIFQYGWRLLIFIRPNFWEAAYEKQVRYLIHEHIHVALHAYHQASDRIVSDWICTHDKSQVEELNQTGAEIAVDHLTEVFYRLLRDRL